ncbi:MAG: FAD-binding oxidoreductase [Bdellovibrionales bacterium]|nr:FAD-binding oxidoreductase [Bdellovibrionales bacterium]
MKVAPFKTDTLVIGAGVIGSAVAMGLIREGVRDVIVADLDLSGEWSSSELNAGGVRATWSQEVNLVASKCSIEYFAENADAVGYRPVGYLWMHRPETWDAALKAREMHVSRGWPVDVLDPAELTRRFPLIDKTSDLAGALFGRRDGLVNPNRLKEHFREEAAHAGSRLMDGVWVHSVVYSAAGAMIRAFQFAAPSKLPSEAKKRVLTEAWSTEFESLGQWIEIECKNIVNCAGAWAPSVAKKLAYACPSEPVRRQISLFHAREVNLSEYGMMIDPSGVYFHPEAIYGLAGFAIKDEPGGYNFGYDAEQFFENYIWPPLYERSTHFESLRHISGWAGLYENSPDHHAIVGPVVGGPANGFAGARVFEAHSFSGHGVMQSFAVGVSLAQQIVRGRYELVDFSKMSAARFTAGGASASGIKEETWVI